jgi:hypothetical protein
MLCGSCPKHGCFQIVGGLGWRRGADTKSCDSQFGRMGGDGGYVEKGRE